nr:MAG TPA: hypothetical protein [Caudoviricetes sp.]
MKQVPIPSEANSTPNKKIPKKNLINQVHINLPIKTRYLLSLILIITYS